jgi:PIN domain nuclease of toxin-antitoxin system
MNLLLDTCTFLWIIKDAPELSERARTAFFEPENNIYLSIISVWEMVIKYQMGRLPFPEHPHQFIPRQRDLHRIESLPLNENSVMQLARLPDHHKDPFDRMLICQAISEGLTLLTPDTHITQYPVATLW